MTIADHTASSTIGLNMSTEERRPNNNNNNNNNNNKMSSDMRSVLDLKTEIGQYVINFLEGTKLDGLFFMDRPVY